MYCTLNTPNGLVSVRVDSVGPDLVQAHVVGSKIESWGPTYTAALQALSERLKRAHRAA